MSNKYPAGPRPIGAGLDAVEARKVARSCWTRGAVTISTSTEEPSGRCLRTHPVVRAPLPGPPAWRQQCEMQGPHHGRRQGWNVPTQASRQRLTRDYDRGVLDRRHPRRLAAGDVARLDSGDPDVAFAIARRCACLGSKQSSGATEPLDETG